MKPPKWGPSPFRFDNIWLENKDLIRKLKIWGEEADVSGWEGCRVIRKVKLMKDKVKKWILESAEAARVIPQFARGEEIIKT